MLDESKPSIDWDSLTFSFTETDRMFISKCEQGGEWEDGIIQDYQDLKDQMDTHEHLHFHTLT